MNEVHFFSESLTRKILPLDPSRSVSNWSRPNSIEGRRCCCCCFCRSVWSLISPGIINQLGFRPLATSCRWWSSFAWLLRSREEMVDLSPPPPPPSFVSLILQSFEKSTRVSQGQTGLIFIPIDSTIAASLACHINEGQIQTNSLIKPCSQTSWLEIRAWLGLRISCCVQD